MRPTLATLLSGEGVNTLTEEWPDEFSDQEGTIMTGDKPPIFFHARATYALKSNQYYRVYLKPPDLLFMQAGPGPAGHVATGAAIHGGAIGGLVGGLIAHRMQKKTETRLKKLDDADWDGLLAMIEENKKNFQEDVSDVVEASIDPKSIWHQIAYSSPNHVGLLRIRFRDRGKMKLEFLAIEDMRLAVEQLPGILGEALTVNVVWNEAKKRFVAK